MFFKNSILFALAHWGLQIGIQKTITNCIHRPYTNKLAIDAHLLFGKFGIQIVLAEPIELGPIPRTGVLLGFAGGATTGADILGH